VNPRVLWGTIALCVLARLAIAVGTDIYPDEAYYWTWSKQLQLAYFDHPALIAWSIRLFGIRPGALVFGLATLPGVYRLAKQLGADHLAALTATALFASTPAANLLGTIATPDAPLLCFWVWTLVALTSTHRLAWLATGALWGLAMLSKYNGILLGAPILLVLFRQPLKVVGAGLVALVVTSPTLIWNATNDWEGFRFQFAHGLGGGGGLNTFLEFVGGQFGMAGPLLLVLMMVWLVKGPRRSPLALALVVPVLFFGWASLKARGEANWSAAAWIAGAVGVAQLNAPRLKLAALGLNVLAIVGGALILITPPPSLLGNQAVQKLHGWAALKRVEPLGLPVFTSRYQLSALTTYYAGVEAGTWEGRRSQYDLWPRPRIEQGTDALWIGEWDGPAPSLRDHFESYEQMEWPADERQRALHDFKLFRLKNAKDTF
jgi:4-amino-4-deoxy-L-arabinose transferase-like glycosyltransferase